MSGVVFKRAVSSQNGMNGNGTTSKIMKRQVFVNGYIFMEGGMSKNTIFGRYYCMRRLFPVFIIALTSLLPACSKHSGTTITVVKPKYHHRWYDRKKDWHKTSRVKRVRVKN
jgi:hypothetical protein